MAERGPEHLNLDRCGLLICGINPSPSTAATGAPYATPGNRLWPALHRAGILPRRVDPRHGLSAADEELLAARGLGFTRLVERPTRTAAELDPAELRAGGAALAARIAAARAAGSPVGTLLVLGLGAYRVAFGRPRARAGRQEDAPVPGVVTWLAGNPSGLNAHETVDSLAAAFARVWADHRARVAGGAD